jgi:hypothetical protein
MIRYSMVDVMILELLLVCDEAIQGTNQRWPLNVSPSSTLRYLTNISLSQTTDMILFQRPPTFLVLIESHFLIALIS